MRLVHYLPYSALAVVLLPLVVVIYVVAVVLRADPVYAKLHPIRENFWEFLISDMPK